MDMFKNISTDSLIQLYKVYNDIVVRCSLFVEEQNDKATEAYEVITKKLALAQQQLTIIKKVLDERRKTVKWSVEEIYKRAGQTDSSVMFEFYSGSTAYENYGEQVHGRILYHRQERIRLESAISLPSVTNSDGQIFLDSGISELPLREKLKAEGFLASDISNFYILGTSTKSYAQPGEKVIPNTHTIKIDPRTFSISGAQMQVLGYYIREGFNLPDHDLLLYYVNLYLFRPEKLNKSDADKYLFEPDGKTLKQQARDIVIAIKMQESISNGSENEAYKTYLENRRKDRLQVITKQLGIAQKVIDELYSANFTSYLSLIGSTVMFETETLEYLDPIAVIYWNFERFIHIFLRHNPNFFVAASTKGQGTSFQYSQKDITRLIKIVVQQEKEKIIDRLKQGKEYAGIGIYYNGNHYQLRIAANGLLLQFHPMD